MSKQTDAIKMYFSQNGIAQKDAAEKIGVSAAAMNNMLADRETIGPKRARRFHEVFGFSVAFLTTGEGALFSEGARVEVSHNSGHSQQNVHVGSGDSSLASENAALKARVNALEAENERLWSMLNRMTEKP